MISGARGVGRAGARAALAALLLAAALPAFAGGAADGAQGPLWETAKDGQKVVVEGTLRRVGSGTFNDLVVSDADGKDWYVERAAAAELGAYEQKRVKVEGVLKLRKMKLANGKELPDRRELTEVRIIE